MDKHNITEGINLYFIETDKFKTFSAMVNIYRKLSKSEAAKNALLLNVLKKGSKNYPEASDISKALEENFGASLSTSVSKKGDVQQLTIMGKAVSDEYSKASSAKQISAMLLEILLNPRVENSSFYEETVALEKENLKNLIDSVLNDKRDYAEKRLCEEMCKNEPFGIFELGNSGDVDAISAKDLFSHYSKILSESPIDIYIVGSIDMKDVFINAFKNFTDKKQNINMTEIINLTEKANYVTEEMEVDQAKLTIGYKINEKITTENYCKYMMYNSIFGGGVHSKLFNNVREKLSLAYYAYSRFIRYKGIVTVGTGILLENYESAKDEIFKQAEEIKKGNISNFEFESSKTAIETMFRAMTDTANGMAEFTTANVLSGINDSLETLVEKVNNVTMEDVLSAAKNISLHTVYFLAPK